MSDINLRALDCTGENSKDLVPKPTVSTRVYKPRGKKSRNGCLSCKRLKIKCSEERPACEYCIHTGRQCRYRVRLDTENQIAACEPQGITIPSDFIMQSIYNRSVQALNSMSNQLNVSRFELQLLKFFLDFGGTFFSVNAQHESFNFWIDTAPHLWCSSDLVKYTLYTLSSARLLANYSQRNNREALIENGNQDSLVNRSVLNEAVSRYSKKALELLDLYYLIIDDPNISTANSEDMLGQLYAARRLYTASRILLPGPGYDRSRRVEDFGLIELMTSTNEFLRNTRKYTPYMKLSSRYATVFDPQVIPEDDYNKYFKDLNLNYIKHLENYVSERISASDDRQITYLNAISKLENSCHQALYFSYPIALFKTIIIMSHDADYIQLLKEEDHTAMKIMFYVCCLNSVFPYNQYERSGIHEEFFYFYKDYSKRRFEHSSWEDDIDKNLYDWAVTGTLTSTKFDLGDMKNIGQSFVQPFKRISV